MNSCNLVGRLTSNLELKTTSKGMSVCSFCLAVNRPHTKDTTDFLNIVAWNQSAEYLCKYALKGYLVSVSGILTSRNFEDTNGNKRKSFEVVTNDVRILESKNNDKEKNQPNNISQQIYNENSNFVEVIDNEDLPF